MLQAISARRRLWMFIFVSMIAMYFIFAPAVNPFYYSGDDFRYALGGWSRLCAQDEGFYFPITLGRPLQAYIDCFSFKFANTFEHMRELRLISVGIMGVTMGVFAEWLCTLGFSVAAAFFASGSVFVIQWIYGDVIFVGAIPLALSVLFVLMSYQSLEKGLARSSKSWIACASLFLLLSLLTYPAMSFFFPCLILLKLLFSGMSRWDDTRRLVMREIIFFFVVCVIYFIYGYINIHYFPQALVPEFYQLDHPNLSLPELFQRGILLMNVFGNQWLVYEYADPVTQGYFVLILLASASLLALKKYSKNKKLVSQDALGHLGQALCLFVIVFGFCNAFVLIIPTRVPLGSRLLFGTAVAGISLVFWGIYQWSTLFKGNWQKNIMTLGMACIFLFGATQANYGTVHQALYFVDYFSFYKSEIKTWLDQGHALRRIHYVIEKPVYPYDKFFITNVALKVLYGTKPYDLQWCSLARGIPGEEKDHQKEMLACIKGLNANGIAVTYSYKSEPYTRTPDMLVVDKDYAPSGLLRALE